MNYKLFIIVPAYFLLLIGCNNSTNEDRYELVTLKYLNRFNTESLIYIGTKEFNEKQKLYKVKLEQKYRFELMDTIISKGNKFDSINSWENSDTLFISHIFFTSGRCLNILPYLEMKRGDLTLFAPEIIDGEIDVENGDTSIIDNACSITTVIEFIFKIPNEKLKGKGKLIYNGEEINLPASD